MKYYGMDPSLVQIYNIRNLESVKVWDLVQNEIGKRVIVPAIMIIYDGGKQLNLCAKDKYFDIYVKKVVEVYKDEKDNILEDNLTDPFRLKSRIDIDDNTKKIFESGNLEKINEIFHFYQGKEAYDESLMFQIDEVRPLIKLVQYHIRRLFDNTDRNISFNDEFSGYRDNYLMSGQINGIESYFPFSYQNNDDSYEFWVNGLVNQNKTVKVSVSFKKDEISVEVKIDGFELVEVSRYIITNGVIKEIHDVTRRGITVGYKNNDLERLDENPLQNIAELDENANLKWYKLPWGAVYGCEIAVEDVSITEKIIEIQNIYVDTFDGGFIKKEYYSKNYKRNKTVTLNAEDMMLDELKKTVVGISIDKDGKLFVIETSFDKDGNQEDFYNGTYGGRHFYHGCYADEGIKSVEKRRLVTLSRKQNVINNSDLVNKYRILKLVKGE